MRAPAAGRRLRCPRGEDHRPSHGGGTRQVGAQRQGPARAVLRPLRCPAGGPARAVEVAAVRAAHRLRQDQRQDHRGARGRGQQGPADDLLRGGAGLAERGWRRTDSHHRAARGRGGVRLAVAAGVPGPARQGGEGRPGARVRHRPVGQGHAGDLDAAARPRRHRARHHRPQPRSALRQLRRGRHEPDPGAGRDHGRDARRQRQGAHPRLLRRHQEALGQAAPAMGGARLRCRASSWVPWA